MKSRAKKDDGYLERILTAKVYDVAVESPLELAPAISRRTGNHVLLKREDKQSVFSFKLRGAYNKMANLAPALLARGVTCASAGNHAQGVALAAQKLGVAATVVMPVTTPRIKVAAVTARGARVELHGDGYHEAYLHARVLARRHRSTFVHPYDDPLVIAGQGTVGLEILRQHARPIDAIYVPVGGGGLVAGIAAYVKRVAPRTRVIGVEPVDSCAMFQSLEAGRRVTLAHVNLFADGVAVRQVGRETLELARRYVDSMVLVDTDEICAAIKDIFEDTRTVLEPAGALALAGAKRDLARRKWKGRTVVAVASGANMNFDRLRFVAERAELGEEREAVLAVTLPERPGAYRELCALLGKRSVTEFNYRYAPGNEAHVFLGVAVAGREETERLVALLRKHGIPAADLSDNEMAKLHGRHLVGGRARLDTPEMLYRFEFPERPGALMNFLAHMGTGWNISLFHYRNHGADVGRVLVGLQVPERERTAFRRFLRDLGYDYADETRNPAYRFFLRCSSARDVAAARAAFEQALAAHRVGDAQGAERAYRKALRSEPAFAEAHYNLAHLMQAAGRIEEAVAGYRRALALRPRMGPAHNNLANALRLQGRADEALAHYAQALRIDPQLADALSNLGTLLRELGRAGEAVAPLERAAALRPGGWQALVNLGIAYHELAREMDAIRCFSRALELEPRAHEAHNGLGNALAAQDDAEGAIAAYRQAMALAPADPDAYSNLGSVLQERGDATAAMDFYRDALERRPDHADALSNLGYLLQEQGQLDEAIGWFERALAANPRAARAGYNLALALLVRGDYARGWPLHELRFDTRPPVAVARGLPQPALGAGDLATPQRIAVWREQGVGDQVVYSTLVPDLAARGHEIVLEVDRRLVAAYARAHPEWKVVGPEDCALSFARCTRQVAVGSLPRLLRPDAASFDSQPPRLLAADPQRVGAYRARLAAPGARTVAISWRSFQPKGRGYLQRKKSAGLAAFAPLAARADLRLVDVQYGDTAAERAQFAQSGGRLARIEELDLFADLEGVLAAIEACDLAITTSNVTAHLAGALGKPTLLFHPAGVAPLHYWAPRADGRSRWYPSVRIVTGPGLESWDASVAAVARVLDSHA